jgi:hypothetical protein
MKRSLAVLLLSAALAAALSGLACSAAAGDMTGLGLILGDTTGFSFKQFMDRHSAFDLAIGAPLGYNVYPGVSVHGDIMYEDEVTPLKRGALLFHLGGGLGLGVASYSSTLELGLRLTAGMEYFFPRSKFAVFGELVPTFVLIHYPGARLNGALGIRFYF